MLKSEIIRNPETGKKMKISITDDVVQLEIYQGLDYGLKNDWQAVLDANGNIDETVIVKKNSDPNYGLGIVFDFAGDKAGDLKITIDPENELYPIFKKMYLELDTCYNSCSALGKYRHVTQKPNELMFFNDLFGNKNLAHPGNRLKLVNNEAGITIEYNSKKVHQVGAYMLYKNNSANGDIAYIPMLTAIYDLNKYLEDKEYDKGMAIKKKTLGIETKPQK